ncbi:MAG: hypothetical protein ABII82_09305 [Verrucomicrobiota bacterium]
MKKTRDIGLTASGISGAFLSIPQVREALEQALGLQIPQAVITTLLITGILLTITGVALFMWNSVVKIYLFLIGDRAPELSYELIPVKRSDLKTAHAFCQIHFGNDIASINTLKKWLKKHPGFAHSLIKISESKGGIRISSEYRGYIDIIPLTQNGEDQIRKSVSITQIPESDIANPGEKPAAVYIGGILGLDRIAKAKIIQATKDIISNFRKVGVTRFYTKPVSKDGFRIVQKYHFSGLDEEECLMNKVCYIDFED